MSTTHTRRTQDSPRQAIHHRTRRPKVPTSRSAGHVNTKEDARIDAFVQPRPCVRCLFLQTGSSSLFLLLVSCDRYLLVLSARPSKVKLSAVRADLANGLISIFDCYLGWWGTRLISDKFTPNYTAWAMSAWCVTGRGLDNALHEERRFLGFAMMLLQIASRSQMMSH